MRVTDFDFHLPPELIAQHPPTQRDAARMLTVDRPTGALADRRFLDLPCLLRPGDLLVLNNSRVIPARLFARRTGLRTQSNSPAPTGLVEVLLTRQRSATDWHALVKPGRKVQIGEVLTFVEQSPASITKQASSVGVENTSLQDANHERSNSAPQVVKPTDAEPLTATVLETGDHGERTLRFHFSGDFFAALDRLGHIPLPPYLHRADTPADRARYQTVYAGETTHGSAAAPTAGLHFTPAVLEEIRANGVEIAHVTLHVGLGTFQPVRVQDLADIRLHAETYTLPADTAAAINRARSEGRRIVAAGTTTVRTLEHCARMSAGAPLHPHTGQTSIFLSPGHQFQLVDALLTNFHLPQSTLLMLVCAFAGTEHVLTAYKHAVAQGYRFFSYGDCMFLA